MDIIAQAKQLRGIIEALASEHLTDEVALTATGLFPKWNTPATYLVGDRVRYDGVLYRCLQNHTSQEDWTPLAAPSLWARVLIPDPEVIPEWVQPDSTNPYMKGDKVTHNNATWESLVDNNVWEPSDALPTLWKRLPDNE